METQKRQDAKVAERKLSEAHIWFLTVSKQQKKQNNHNTWTNLNKRVENIRKANASIQETMTSCLFV